MKKAKHSLSSEAGFSLIELVIVMLLLLILTVSAGLGMALTRIHGADAQAVALMDIFQEARQKALTQGKTLRVEINDTKKQIRLIDENATNASTDDIVITTLNINRATTVGVTPANVTGATPALPKGNSPIPVIQYTQTSYPLSKNNKVKTLRFLKSGEVVDAGTDNLGTGALTSGTTIYVYNGAEGSKSSVVRAITLSGITADAQVFKCQADTQGICKGWVK
jgi:prepilin-type N-terminal cleavage/methylation domain-containing protein